jgi:uncharacterized protein (DUF302 family)
MIVGLAISRAPATHQTEAKENRDMDGLRTRASTFGPKDTMDRLEASVRERGMTVFARIDHAAGAAQAGLTLRPTELLIFGAAKAGTPLMQAKQTLGIDLPLKALVWQDAEGRTWVSYDEPRWLVSRHGVDPALASIGAMAAMLEDVSKEASEGR